MAASIQTVSKNLLSLQYLRGAAALAIVLYHAEAGVNVYMPAARSLNLFEWGREGVPLFFVLSGFVVALAGYRRPRPGPAFLYTRLARLYPAYLFTAGLFVMALLLLPSSVFRSPLPITLAGLTKTLFFEYGQINGYVYVGWVLFYEACFYIVFSLVIARFPRISSQRWFDALIAFGLVVTALTGHSVISYFLTGLAVFLLIQNPAGLPSLSLRRLALLLAMVLNGIRTPVSLMAFALVAALVFLESGRVVPNPFSSPRRCLLAIGDASYSIYLAQVLTLSACLKLSRSVLIGLTPSLPEATTYLLYWVSAILLSLASTLVVGLLMRRFIEIPSYRWLMGRMTALIRSA